MDWQLLVITFGIVFLSELGDKSQLAAIFLSGSCKHPRAIFTGAAVALVFASLLGIFVGDGVAHILPTELIKGVAACFFAGLGLSMLWPNRGNERASDEAAS
ncbi:MAG: TMEM165/GDT1 family protein [Cyanobacteria bacterium P01_F01_bin.42]